MTRRFSLAWPHSIYLTMSYTLRKHQLTAVKMSTLVWTALLFCVFITHARKAGSSNIHSGPGEEVGNNPDVGSIPSPVLDRKKRMVKTSKSTTDIPEEIEIQEGATNKDGLPVSTGAEDPTEENDLTRRLTPRATPPTNFATTVASPDLRRATTPNASPESVTSPVDVEAEEQTNGGEGGSCPAFTDTTLEHHVILRQDGCEIFISQDDSIRWFGQPGESPPSVYMRHYK